MAKKKKELSPALRRFFGVGDFGFNLMTSVETYYQSFFFTNIAEFTPAVAGMLSSVIGIVDAVMSWLYGGIINGSKPMKWGRYRSWMLVTPWIVPFLYAFEFLKVSNSALTYFTICAGGILSHVIWNFSYVASVSMINVASENPDDKIALASIRGTWNNIAGILFSYLGLPLASVLGGIIGETNRIGALAFVLGCVMVVGMYAHFKMFDGYEDIEAEMAAAKSNDKNSADKVSAGDMAKALFTNAPLLSLLVADLAKWMFKFVIGGFAVYYITYVGKNVGLQATYVLASNLAAVVGAYAAKYISKAFSTRKTAIGIMAAMAVLMFIGYLIRYNVVPALVLMCIAQIGYGVVYCCTPALYADAVVYSHWKLGKDVSGFIMGLQNLPLKVGSMLRGMLIAAILAWAGFETGMDAASATTSLMDGVSIGFMVIPAAALILGAVLLLIFFRIDKADVIKYQAEINQREGK